MQGSMAESRLEVLQVYKLLQCVRKGDQPQIEKLIRMGAPGLINLTETQEGRGALHQASVDNCTDMVQFLLSQGADPNIQDRNGRTPAMCAAELGHDKVIALLVKGNANMNVLDSEGRGVLFYCLSPTKRHLRCLQLVLSGAVDVNNVSFTGTPVFLLACEQAQDCEVMCMELLEKGADPNSTNQTTGRTPVMEAAREGSVNLVREILRKGGDPNALDKKRMHAAHFAAQGGFFEIICVLSAYLADLGVMATDGNTPLHYAAKGGFPECCRFLAQRGCNPKVKNQEGLMPRQIAKDSGHKLALKELKKAEKLYNKFSKPGVVNPNELWALALHDWSFEHEAELLAAFEVAEDAASGIATIFKETFISVLQENGAPADADKLHAVFLAHDKKREGVINLGEFFKGLKYLQKAFVISSYGPKKKKKPSKARKGKKKGKLVLPMPICTLPPELIQRREDGGPPHFMIESYQNYTDTNRFDRDHPPKHPIEDDSAWYIDEPDKIYRNINYCVMSGDMESLMLAFRQRVPVDVKDPYYKTPLMTACACGNYEAAKFLLGLGADVNMCDQFGWTPLHHACHAGQLDIIELLVQAGAGVEAPAWNGATPLMRAIESCRLSCVDYLLKAGAKVQVENKKGQNCLDIARAYADLRIVDLIQDQFDSLPKPKDKKGKGAKPQPKIKSATSTKDKAPALASPVTLEITVKKDALRDSIVFQNAQITSGAANRVDISFVPKTVWGNQLTTNQLLQSKEEWRERHSCEVDFEDFLMPFNKNIAEKSQELTTADE